MRIRWGLVMWWVRPRLAVSIPLAFVACVWVLFVRRLDQGALFWAMAFAVVHGFLLVRRGDFEGPGAGFIHTRGYSRDALWAHLFLGMLLAAAVTWLPAALVVWTPARSALQDALFASPYYPLMYGADAWIPVLWLGYYVLSIGAFVYGEVRAAQPTRGGPSGRVLAAGVVFVYGLLPFMVAVALIGRVEAVKWAYLGTGAFCAALLIAASWLLFRRMEVR